MKCINGARTFLFYNIHHQQQQQHYHHSLINSKTRSWPQQQRQTTQAVLLHSDSVVVLASAAAAADLNILAQPKGDINVFLQTGGLMLSAYLLANFVVPNIVLKQLADETKEPEISKTTADAETSNQQQQQTPKKSKKNRD